MAGRLQREGARLMAWGAGLLGLPLVPLAVGLVSGRDVAALAGMAMTVAMIVGWPSGLLLLLLGVARRGRSAVPGSDRPGAVAR